MSEIWFPDVADVSERGLVLEPDTVAIIAKASEGHTFKDPSYIWFRDQAYAINAVFSAYHWLHPGNEQLQAEFCFNIVGSDTDLMIDAENVTSDGFNTVDGITAFTDAYRGIGGNVRRLYLPHWYWQDHMGAMTPDLTPCVERSLLLVASNYRRYDSGNWPAPYGGYSEVFQWQYTDAFGYSGKRVDFNAVRMTLAEYVDALRATVPLPVPTPPPSWPKRYLKYPPYTIGADVRMWQEKMRARGWSITVDGVYGRESRNVCMQFQRNHDLTVDGIVGPMTWARTWGP